MKNVLRHVLVVLLASSSTAFAAGGAESEGLSWMVILFLVFGGLILVFQMIPGLLLFFSMVRGFFSETTKDTAPAISGESDKKHWE